MDLIERLRERRVTRWVQSTGMPPKSDGFSRDALCVEAADEIERLTKERDALVAAIQESLPFTMIPAMETLTAALKGKTVEIDALRMDAERYRWLKGNRIDSFLTGSECGTELDAAIDAVMKEKP